MYKNWEDKLIHNKRMAFTQNEKKPTDDNAKPSIVCYRSSIVVLLFTFKKLGQLPTFLVNDH